MELKGRKLLYAVFDQDFKEQTKVAKQREHNNNVRDKKCVCKSELALMPQNIYENKPGLN